MADPSSTEKLHPIDTTVEKSIQEHCLRRSGETSVDVEDFEIEPIDFVEGTETELSASTESIIGPPLSEEAVEKTSTAAQVEKEKIAKKPHIPSQRDLPESLKTTIPRYVVNLDAPVAERWNEVIDDYRMRLVDLERRVSDDLRNEVGRIKGAILEKAVSAIMSFLNSTGAVYYNRELRAIAHRSRLPLGKLVTLQLVYEVSAACTSVIVNGPDGYPIHARTMDWAMDFLKDITIEVDFQSKGKTEFIATTWVGYVGVLTGMRPGSYSAAVNFRVSQTGSIWDNLKKALGSGWPIGFLLRETLADAKTYQKAVSWLSNSKLIAPCYFTVCGSKENEGALITRRRMAELNRWDLHEKGSIVQPNMDHWSNNPDEDIMFSRNRRTFVRNWLKNEKNTVESLWTMMCMDPVLNELTVYKCIMIPKRGILATRLVD